MLPHQLVLMQNSLLFIGINSAIISYLVPLQDSKTTWILLKVMLRDKGTL